MPDVFFTCVGTTDPVRGGRDGGVLHIMRNYRPQKVYLWTARAGIMTRLSWCASLGRCSRRLIPMSATRRCLLCMTGAKSTFGSSFESLHVTGSHHI